MVAEPSEAMQSGDDGGAGSWRADALDVRGPGRHGRGRPAEGAGMAGEGSPGGDRGTLWIADGLLWFAGRREAWALPLGWLEEPRADLAGVTRLEVYGDDRARAVTFRFARGAADEKGLATAIRRSRLNPPDERDRRALQEMLALVRRELDALSGGGGAEPFGTRALAAAARLRGAWLPSAGRPAVRLRDATVGLLIAAAEAATPERDADAGGRYEQSARRWRNVCEDLRDWCGVPELTDLPLPEPVTRAPSMPAAEEQPPPDAGAPRAQQPAIPAVPAQAAPTPPEPRMAVQPPSLPTRPQPTAPPLEPRVTEPRAVEPPPLARPYEQPRASEPPLPPPAPAASSFGPAAVPVPTADEEERTIIIRGGGAVPPPVQQEAPRDVEPPDDQTIISEPRRAPAEQAATAPKPAGASATQPAVVSGAGRPGSGGMTMVYRRGGPGPAGSIARKELEPDSRGQANVQAFLDIGHRFEAVRHQNFVHISDVAIDPDTDTPFIEMEFVEGESLHARQRRGPTPVDQALDLVDQLAAAIDAVHQAGLVHGDVRPQNVLVEPGGRAVLLEPSVACEYTLEQNRGTIYGELPYLTPERVAGEQAVPNSDIYALGTLAFALLAGRPPFNGSPAEIFAGHAELPPPALDQLLAGAPRAASVAIARTLAKSPQDRPVSATTFAAELRAAFAAPQTLPGATGFGGPPASTGVAPAAPTSPPRGQPEQPGRRLPGPLGRIAPSPLGRRPPPPEEPPDDPDHTVVVRPRR